MSTENLAPEQQVRPWGVHSIGDIYPADCAAGLPDGRYVRAVAEPYHGNRLSAAWWVLTGRAHAIVWPKPGDLERSLRISPRSRKAVSP